jgi:hypothetical protein
MKLFSVFLLLLAALLSSCNFVSDYGNTSASEVKGYLTYTNHTLGISVLAPSQWENEMTIGGSYNMNPKPHSAYDGISVSSSRLSDLFDGKLPADATLDDVQRLAKTNWYNAESIGPDFEVSWSRTTLSGKPAWEVAYAYTPESSDRRLVREIITIHKGKAYFLRWYAKASDKDRFASEFQVIRNSLNIVD